ncbi:MAG: ribosomal protein S18-alanine N-acetyltransferase [Anaerolineales bacterium]
MNIVIRAMTAADLEAVTELDALSFSQPWPQNAFKLELANEGARCWVADAAPSALPVVEGQTGQVVGTLVFWRVLDEAHLTTIAVHPAFRRRGIARQLLQTAMDAAYAEGARIYHLEVRAGNVAAQKLYAAFGFEVVGRRPKYYQDTGEDAVLMTKTVVSEQ